jgi:hypothetical protein
MHRCGRALKRRYGRSDGSGGYDEVTYLVWYVHKISPSDKDVAGPIYLNSKDLASKKSLSAALRKDRILGAGGSIRSFRTESGGKIVVFPNASIWHAIILTPVGG